MTPVVTVITIFWNAAEYLTEAVASVQAQTLADWELLLVDDGSSDDGPAIAARLAAADSRIRLLRHEDGGNHGTGRSRNLGLEHARGRYVAFLDADDVYESERLELTAAVLDARPEVGTVISRERYWREWADADPARRTVAPDRVIGPVGPMESVIEPGRLLYSILAAPGAPMPGICSVTFRRPLLPAEAPIPDRFRDQYEDQVLIAQLLLAAPCWLTPACLSRYRQHPTSLTRRARETGEYRPGRPHAARDRYLEWLEAHLRENAMWDAAWADVLAQDRAAASAREHNPLGAVRWLAAAAAERLPRRLVRHVVSRMWRVQDRRVRRRALEALAAAPVPRSGGPA